MLGRIWVLPALVAAVVGVWAPIVAGSSPAVLGCPHGAATDPRALLGWVAAGQALASPAPPAPPPQPSPLAGRRLQIVIEGKQRRLYLFADGQVYKSWPVAVGTMGTPTPIGHFAIAAKAVWGGAFGARWMQLSIPWGTYGIHGTNNPGSIGSRASHGCIRMFNRDVVALYALAPVGTPVDIRGQPVARFGEVRRVIVPTLIGSDILQLQQRLAALGLDAGPANGRYAGKAVAALTRFQSERGLPATGIVDFATAQALGLVPLSEDESLRPTPVGLEPPPPAATAPHPLGGR